MTVRSEPPRRLIDPDGEGVYLLSDWSWNPPAMPTRRTAQNILALDDWRHIDVEYVWLAEDEDGLWRPASPGRWPRYWKLNLPRRFRPVEYAYCTPAPSDQRDSA